METQNSNQLAKPMVAVLLTASGSHHFISAETVQEINETSDKNVMVELDDGAFVRFSGIMEIVAAADYIKEHPEIKHQSTAYGQPYPIPASRDKTEALANIVAEFKWAADAFKFNDLPLLVIRTWDRLENWTGSFEEFCIKFKALTPTGEIATAPGVFYDKKTGEKFENRVAFAYPFFCAIKTAGEALAEKEGRVINWDDLGKPKTQEEIINEAPVSGLEAMIDGLDKHLSENPNNTKGKMLREQMVKKLRVKTNAKPEAPKTV